jgi:hypothetical protein
MFFLLAFTFYGFSITNWSLAAFFTSSDGGSDKIGISPKVNICFDEFFCV